MSGWLPIAGVPPSVGCRCDPLLGLSVRCTVSWLGTTEEEGESSPTTSGARCLAEVEDSINTTISQPRGWPIVRGIVISPSLVLWVVGVILTSVWRRRTKVLGGMSSGVSSAGVGSAGRRQAAPANSRTGHAEFGFSFNNVSYDWILSTRPSISCTDRTPSGINDFAATIYTY